MSRTAILAIGGSIVLSAAAQLGLKAGVLSLPRGSIETLGTLTGWVAGAHPCAVSWIAASLLCYAVSMVLWLVALRACPLSIAYPSLSLSYILVYAGAIWWPRLHETATWARSAGTLLIAAGVVLVASNRTRQHFLNEQDMS